MTAWNDWLCIANKRISFTKLSSIFCSHINQTTPRDKVALLILITLKSRDKVASVYINHAETTWSCHWWSMYVRNLCLSPSLLFPTINIRNKSYVGDSFLGFDHRFSIILWTYSILLRACLFLTRQILKIYNEFCTYFMGFIYLFLVLLLINSNNFKNISKFQL